MKTSVLVFSGLSMATAVYAAVSYRRVFGPAASPASASIRSTGIAPGPVSGSPSQALRSPVIPGSLGTRQDDPEEGAGDEAEEVAEGAMPTPDRSRPVQAHPPGAARSSAPPRAKYTLSDPVNLQDPAYVRTLVQAYGGRAVYKLQSVVTGDYEAPMKVQALDGIVEILKDEPSPGDEGTEEDPAPQEEPVGDGGGPPPPPPGDTGLGGLAGDVLLDAALNNPDPNLRERAWKGLVDVQRNSMGRLTLYKKALVSENGKLGNGSSGIKRWARSELRAIGVLR